MLVGAAAAVGQAAVTAVLLAAGDVDVTAAIHQQILPFTDVPCKSETTLSINPAGLQPPPRGDPGAAMKAPNTKNRDRIRSPEHPQHRTGRNQTLRGEDSLPQCGPLQNTQTPIL